MDSVKYNKVKYIVFNNEVVEVYVLTETLIQKRYTKC